MLLFNFKVPKDYLFSFTCIFYREKKKIGMCLLNYSERGVEIAMPKKF